MVLPMQRQEQNEVIQSLDNDIHTISELSQARSAKLKQYLGRMYALKTAI